MFLIGSGCVTANSPDATPESAPAASESAAPSGTSVEGSDQAFELGPLIDEDLRRKIYEAVETQLSGTKGAGGSGEEQTEIGDFEAFHFNIVKLMHGSDDVSGDPRARPDSMEVEVVGWLKRRLVASSGDPKDECASFDGQITLEMGAEGAWAVRASAAPLTLGRQDQEDCY